MATEYKERGEIWERAEMCTGMVVYDDARGRDRAIALCQRLARRFEGDLAFDFSWWRFKYLSDAAIAAQAAVAAAQADLFVLSLQNSKTLLPEIGTWCERWMMQRVPSRGALVVVRESGSEPSWVEPEDTYLESLAQRANLDYVPLSITTAEAHLVDRLREDGVPPDITQLPPVRDQQYHSSGWGINE